MAIQDWNDGQRLTVKNGSQAQNVNHIVNPINAAFLYNSTQAAQGVTVNFVGSNQYAGEITVPQTTGNAGSAALFTFSGPGSPGVGSQSLTATVLQSSGSVSTWIGSQALPVDDRNLINEPLPANNEPHPFDKYRRYYFVPSAQHYVLNVQSGVSAFYFALFTDSGSVDIYVLNAPDRRYKPVVEQFPGDKYAVAATNVKATTDSNIAISIFGRNQQWVLMNADSEVDSNNVSVTLSALG